MGETRFTFESDGERWTLTSDTKGTKGLAKFLGISENFVSKGRWVDGQARPDGFDQNVKISIKKIHNQATFDWEAGQVTSVHEDGTSLLPLEPGVQDPTSIGLAIRSGLNAGETAWRIPLVDEDEIEIHRFEDQGEDAIESPLGCLQTRRVDRIRGPESRRYTRTWYATNHDFVPVRIEHGKTDGDHLETQIVELVIDGESIAPGPSCSQAEAAAPAS